MILEEETGINTMKTEEKKIKIVYAEPADYFPKEICLPLISKLALEQSSAVRW